MDKEMIKILSIIMLISCYFPTLILILFCDPLEVLIANVIIWIIVVILILGFKFVDWLID